MNEQNKNICVNCKRTDEQTPLLKLTFKGEDTSICAQCLPILIHKTRQLADQFPGMDVSAVEH